MSNTDLINFDNTRGVNYQAPSNVVFSNGVYRVPPGHVFDARPGIILFNGSLLDNAPNGNLIQGSTFPSPDTVTITGNSSESSVLSSDAVTAESIFKTSVLASSNIAITGVNVPDRTFGNFVAASTDVVINDTDERIRHCAVIACAGATEITGSAIRCVAIGNNQAKFNSVVPAGTTTHSNGDSMISACLESSMITNDLGVNSSHRYSHITASRGCELISNIVPSQRNMIQSSQFSTITDSNMSTALSSNNGSVNTCSQTVIGGNAPSATAVSNCLVWGTTSPTASNQAAFGTDILVRNNRDLTVETGFSSAAQGHIGNYRTVTTGTTTLLVTDGTIKLSPGTTLTLPLASAMAANYPLDKDRSWTIIADPIVLGNLVPPVMNVTAPNLINGKTNWTSHVFKAPGQRIRLMLVNTSLTTGWYIADDIEYNSYVFTAVDNNFGAGPPQSDANQLPLSANKAAHDALLGSSYVTFEGLTQNSSNLISLANPGFTVNIVSGLDISYSFEIFFSANAASGYIIRSDIINVTTGQIVAGSYIEVGGNNGREGTQIVSKTCRGTIVLGANTFQLRISQDTALPISSAASIRNVQLNINAIL